jgi:transglutaminase-like putative cysteine protease
MYDIRQFKPALYLVLMLGITGFSLAAESPGLWILAAGGIGINAWLVKNHRFSPMPRLLANIVTLGSLALVAMEVRAGDATPILTVGQYIVLLHLIKLFEQRANRDYAQLLVLSLLLMIAASISTASLLFGMTLIAYMFSSLYCCLLFHLKMEMDEARRIYGQPADAGQSEMLRQDQRGLPRSMRRLTGLIAVAGVATAVMVFIFFPRGAGQGLFNPVQARASQALTGFSDQVSLGKVAQIARSEDVIARVELYIRGQKVVHPTDLMLRGSVLDVYSGKDINRGGLWQWYRSAPLERLGEPTELEAETPMILDRLGAGQCTQVISLQPTGTNKLFAMAGPVRITAEHDMRIRFSPTDGVIESESSLLQPIRYTVTSTLRLSPALNNLSDDSEARSVIDPEILQYVRDPAVCGSDPEGRPLADYPVAGNHVFDGQIAANIERYLGTHFKYTLDLTNLGSLGDRDPMVAFLTDFKKGHCEYFAGAMTLMCQSLGIPARYVVGFRCGPEDFNSLGKYFLVKESNAHAWCEVFTGQTWETFDPTSRQADLVADRQYFPELRKMFDYLEFKWASNVVAYDTTQRRDILDNMDIQINRAATDGTTSISEGMENFRARIASPTVLSSVIASMIGLGILLITWYLIDRWRIRRRARRIGLELLPLSDRMRLVRQLGFYDDLLRILQRHRIERPRHLTPMEFSRSLSYLPSNAYNDIRRLTELFYRIRYGEVTGTVHPRRNLTAAIYRIQQTLESAYRYSHEQADT